jgi:hypothetical protein
MKTAAAIGMIAAALSLNGFAAENIQSPEASSKVAPAMSRAAEAYQYLFVFFYEKDDDATRAARKTFGPCGSSTARFNPTGTRSP